MFCFCIILTSVVAQNPLKPIGNWREHLSYQQAIQVVKGNKLYCASQNAVFSVDATDGITRYSKITGLNDIGVKAFEYDATTQQLVIGYNNANLDVLKDGLVKNIGDIKRSGIAGNKTINQIYCANGFAYLSTGLGVIVADLNKYEIKDTWFIGNNGAQININAFTSDGSFFYAATQEGLKKADAKSATISNFSSWQLMNGNSGLSMGAVQQVLILNKNIVIQKNDSLFIQKNGQWTLLYTDPTWPIINTNSSGNYLQISQRKSSGAARVLVMDENSSINQTVSKPGVISYPKNALKDGSNIWIADLYGGLSLFNNAVEQFIPNGPQGMASGDMVFSQSTLYAAAGSINDAWNYQYNRDGFYKYADENWSNTNYYNSPQLDSVFDFITLAVDPSNQSIWAGSYGGGLINKAGENIRIYKQKNTTLQAALGDPTSYRISGLAFDQDNNLWISNYGAAKNLQVRLKDSTWAAFSIPFSHTENAVSQIVIDDANQLWIVSPKGNGIFCYNHGNNILATTDDKWKNYLAGSGNGNLPSNTVLCLAKDKNGSIWIGTNNGIGIIQCASEAFSGSSCEALLPIVQQDRFAGLLFHNEIVQCIAVDGANRKWVGTKNGVWLISPDGDKIIYQFTENNSPLLGNDVKRIAINPINGEVFFATNYGICSFRSTATEPSVSNNNILVFPNPVLPNYNGTIAIRGLSNNALVKIAELSGQLVFQTRALGGQAIWDGKNYLGNKVASGVYLVLVRDELGQEKMMTKLVILSGR
ncbi:MAG: hypothetical protein NTY72_02410 [Bacteroidetes bacterium]|nr:hypothetical protein [Bacteroidota bacterium]